MDPAKEKALSDEQAGDLEALLGALKDLEQRFAGAEMPQPYEPLPTPILRVRPPL